MSAVLDPNMRSQKVATHGAIRIEDVVKIYDPDGAAVMAVDHCSLDIPAGEMVSGEFGLGYVINTSYTMVRYPTIVIGMVTLGAVGYLTSALVRMVGDCIHYRPPNASSRTRHCIM